MGEKEQKNSNDIRRVLIDYHEKSVEMAQNLILVRSALEGIVHTRLCNGLEYLEEEFSDLIYLCDIHLTAAARHMKKTPYLESNGGAT